MAFENLIRIQAPYKALRGPFEALEGLTQGPKNLLRPVEVLEVLHDALESLIRTSQGR